MYSFKPKARAILYYAHSPGPIVKAILNDQSISETELEVSLPLDEAEQISKPPPEPIQNIVNLVTGKLPKGKMKQTQTSVEQAHFLQQFDTFDDDDAAPIIIQARDGRKIRLENQGIQVEEDTVFRESFSCQFGNEVD